MQTINIYLDELLITLSGDEGCTPLRDYLLDVINKTGLHASDILCVIEQEYVDSNFSDEFDAFYSKLFQAPSKLTTRIHLFKPTSLELQEDDPGELDLTAAAGGGQGDKGTLHFRPGFWR